MEAIGLGANVVAFIVIASQLSKKLYIILSSIKDGPSNVQRVAGHLLQLNNILEQLRHSPLAYHDTELARHVASCVSDLESLFNSMQKLRSMKGERKTKRIWKHFKSFLSESKLDCIREQISAHVSTLNFRLSILHSITTYELLSSARTVNQSIDNLSCNVEEQTEIINTRFDGLCSGFHTRDENLHSRLISLQETVDDMSSVSHQRADSILDILTEIKKSITNPDGGAFQQGKSIDEVSKQADYTSRGENAESPGPGLIRSITRLCGLMEEKCTTFDKDTEEDTKAEDIIEDLWILVDSVQKYGGVATPSTREISSTGTQNSLDQKAFRSNLMRFRQSFGNYKIFVNQETREPNSHPFTAVRQERTYTRVPIGGIGTVSLAVTKCVTAGGSNPTATSYTYCTMILSFIPQDPRQFGMIVASATQIRTAKGAVTPISRLAINRVLPSGSRIFTVVKHGRLQELQAMLKEGKATLRDHDEYGASLLFYAAYSRQVEMCKFLLENGADVDHVSSAHGLGGWLYNDTRPRYVLELDMLFGEMGTKTPESYKADSCRRLIIEAGADPSATTLTSHKVTPSFLEWVATSGHPETMNLIWGGGLGKLFVDVNEPLPTGIPPFLHCCTSFAGDRAVEGLCKLLDAGANINARDDQGQSCLHRCLQLFWAPLEKKWIRKHFDVVQLLVTRGADVYARDNRGQSVREVAYSQKDLQYGRRGSYVGDLWDAVLQSCGYDVAEFRRDYRRRANYTDSYTRQDFEAIWKGREDQCPYWNDNPWPPEVRSCYPILNSIRDGSIHAGDISGSDRFGEPAESSFIDNRGEGREIWGRRSGRDQENLEITEAADPYHA